MKTISWVSADRLFYALFTKNMKIKNIFSAAKNRVIFE